MQVVRRRIGAMFVLMAALVALAAFGVASSAMAGTTSKHKGAKHAAKHVAKKASAKHARLLSATKTAASPSDSGSAAETPGTETGGAAERAADTAAQDAACKAANIDPNGNVQFDDQTNTCSLDTGGTDTQTG